MTYAYLRQMPNAFSLPEQQQSIIGLALLHSVELDKEVVEQSGGNRPIEERKQFEAFLHSLKENDSLFVDEIWVLSSHVDELVKIINCMISRKVNLYISRLGIKITKDTAVGLVMPLLNNLRENQLGNRGVVGRPKGSKSYSKFDAFQPKILSLLQEGHNVSVIARELNVSRSSLKDYIQSRDLKALANASLIEIAKPLEGAVQQDRLLICPFEHKNYQQEGV